MSHSSGQTVTFGDGETYTLDEFGFLDPPAQWDEVFAEGMARAQGIYEGLSEEHWGFISYLRDKALREKTVPLMVSACADNKIRLGRLKSLFPTGYFRGACRIAGISHSFLCEVNIWHTYENVERLAPEHKLTPQGFLENFSTWSERFAHMVSASWELPDELTPVHWEIIRFLRGRFEATGSIPTVYEVCETHDLDLDDFEGLFPPGYRRGACRIAGLPFFA